MARDPAGLELRADPTALAPERLLVFEVRGSVGTFADAIRRVPGLELIDEEELEADETDKTPAAYLMVPDARALQQLLSLWQRWLRGELQWGETPWGTVFSLLRDLRPWGPQDRVQPYDASVLAQEVTGRLDDDLVRLEVELVFRASKRAGQAQEEAVRQGVTAQTGQVVSSSRIEDIAYHALLVDLPVRALRAVIERSADGIAGLEPVMHIRPQSVASSIEVEEAEDGPDGLATQVLGEPILALLDGVPVARHRLLADHLVVDDPLNLEPATLVTERVHGTAMASLIVHGDRNRPESPLPRRIHVVPVLGPRDAFPSDRLIIDVIYNAVLRMRDGAEATAPGVVIVNVSLGNARRPFSGQLSAWARLLDRLAYHYGLLFVVSAGNCTDAFPIEAFATHTLFEDADPAHRAQETLRSLGNIVADRRLLSPAETVNGLTVGACNEDAVVAADRRIARSIVDPFGEHRMANPSSSLGPGFAAAVKPDVLLPGAREHLRLVARHAHIEVAPAPPTRSAGLRVAAPPRGGVENADGFTNGTSAATALGSRTAHRIHDALEATYGATFSGMAPRQRAVLLKALLAHTARWPDTTANLIRDVIGPPDGRQHVRQKDNIRRFLGFGIVDPDDAVACADDRATFWASGELAPDKVCVVNVPVPIAMGGQAVPHALTATLAWFTPTAPGRKSYRSVRLKIIEPNSLGTLGLKSHRDQPDVNQTNRGTLFMRSWTGSRAPVVGAATTIPLTIQRDPNQGVSIDDPIPFGLAVTLTMPGIAEIYEQVRQRLGLGLRAPA
ncbi:S8 family peptidase [Rubellimicrobium rubrum]|uniref:S8 family peptidase n=2 Tax=Rubellimicrobium rubrum TaxID=2585369 RepID=A0A5C4MKJ4_9RHOB|nr:S8 family peptidase [Rubellimicrobium rubrum]